MLLFSH